MVRAFAFRPEGFDASAAAAAAAPSAFRKDIWQVVRAVVISLAARSRDGRGELELGEPAGIGGGGGGGMCLPL